MESKLVGRGGGGVPSPVMKRSALLTIWEAAGSTACAGDAAEPDCWRREPGPAARGQARTRKG